mmetsp:Transcript_15713/g.48844  ORF Transcript_15713/g.48844 Transcript_15713/m.48844 type:complete len:248 (-) Transcript_15713:48-791(-)
MRPLPNAGAPSILPPLLATRRKQSPCGCSPPARTLRSRLPTGRPRRKSRTRSGTRPCTAHSRALRRRSTIRRGRREAPPSPISRQSREGSAMFKQPHARLPPGFVCRGRVTTSMSSADASMSSAHLTGSVSAEKPSASICVCSCRKAKSKTSPKPIVSMRLRRRNVPSGLVKIVTSLTIPNATMSAPHSWLSAKARLPSSVPAVTSPKSPRVNSASPRIGSIAPGAMRLRSPGASSKPSASSVQSFT